MFWQKPNQSYARRTRILVFASGFLALGIILFALPVFAASITIDQCGNGVGVNPMSCAWTTGIVGNSNSHYIEGMAVPQRFLLEGLYGGTAATQCNATTKRCVVTFSVTWSDVTAHGYDFLVSWQDAVKLAKYRTGVSDLILNPCSNYNNAQEIACTSAYTNGSYIDVIVPDDPFVSGSWEVTDTVQSRIDAYEAIWGNRTIRLHASSPITAAELTLRHCNSNLSTCPIADRADTSGTTVISYTLVFTTNATNALLTFAPHLAHSGNPRTYGQAWGYQLGAGGTGGANWHVKDPKINSTGGSQDNQANLDFTSAWPISSTTRANGGTLTSGVVTDSVVITNTKSGATNIGGYVHYYVCADTTAPYSPADSSSIPYGCLQPTSGSGFTVTDIGTRSLTILNNLGGGGKNSVGVSAVFTPTFRGRYCFLTVYHPTDTIPYDYGVMTDTNGTSECFYYDNPTAVQLSSLRASPNTDWTMLAIALGLLGVVASVGIVKFGFRRN